MRPVLVFTLSRLGLFAAALGVLYLLGLSDLPLFVVALVVSGLASYVLLSRQRDAVSEQIARNRRKPGES